MARVRVVNGNTAIPEGVSDDPANGVDLVVMDDFIYGEPKPAETNLNALINLVSVRGSLDNNPQPNAPAGAFTLVLMRGQMRGRGRFICRSFVVKKSTPAKS